MMYEYSEEEKAFREEYYHRLGFDNTLFSDLPLAMQPPKVRNEINAICKDFNAPDIQSIINNEMTIGQYVARHLDFNYKLIQADGIHVFKQNKEFLLARNSYDAARERQVQGMNQRISQMFQQAVDIDIRNLMDKASDKDRVVCDVYSETIADFNQILARTPDKKDDVEKAVRVNSVYELGQMFDAKAELNTEAFRRLYNVFQPSEENAYSPFMLRQMKEAFPSMETKYAKMDEHFAVKSMADEISLPSFLNTLNEKSPLGANQAKYGEQVFTAIKNRPELSSFFDNYAGRCTESARIDRLDRLAKQGGDSPESLYAVGIGSAGVGICGESPNLKYLTDIEGKRIKSFSYQINEHAIRYMLEQQPSLKLDVLRQVVKDNDPYLHYLSEAEQNKSIEVIVENITHKRVKAGPDR